MMSSSPMTKTGVAEPARVSQVRTRSVSRPRRQAESTPVPTPSSSHPAKAPMTSEPVTGSLARMSWVTCWSDW